MEIKSLLIKNDLQTKNNTSLQPCFKISGRNLAPLKSDTLSFGSNLKKSDFQGLDRVVIETYKINPQQLKTKDDLQKIAKEKVEELKEKDYGGRSEETKIQRKAMLKEWFNYVTQENDAYSNTQQLIILSGITKELKEDNDNIPPVLNKGVLADVISELEEELKINPSKKFDFNKIYQNKIRSNYLEDSTTGETMTGWVVIPSRANDPENFEKNVEKLKTLSHKNWCTKSFNAEPYLSEGDFHIYLEEGQPKLGVRFQGDMVAEIQGEKNNSEIPLKYLDVFKTHQEECKLKLDYSTQCEVERAEELKKKLGSSAELKTIDDAEKIFNCLDIKAEKNENQTGLIIDSYGIFQKYSLEDIDVDERKLFEFVIGIKGNADFKNSKITTLGNLESIGKDANFTDSRITNLGNLKTIGGNANFNKSQITNINNLRTIGGDADFRSSKITDLGNLESIGGNAHFSNSQITNLNNLRSIGKDACFQRSQITSLGNLETIGKDAFFTLSQITDLGNLKSIGRDAYFAQSQVTDLGNLETIGGHVWLSKSKLTQEDFKNIKIGRKIHQSSLKDELFS